MRATVGVSLFLIASYVAVCLVGADREYDPPSPPRGPSVPASSSSDALSQLLNDSKLSRLLDDPDLWLILKKRLGGGGGGEDDEDRCSADRKTNNTIIKTKDSLDAGATFIAAPSVANYRDCEDECCKEEACNTAVVNLKESKNGRSEGIACYLFDCKSPSVCVFTLHPGFIVMQFDSKRKSIDRQADELSKLISSTSTTITSSTPTSSTTVTTKAGQTENDARKDRVGLFSECRKSSDCKDQNTDCLAGYCICQRNYHAVEMQCRKDCDQELEFECSNKNSPLFSECIAVYDYCDGIAQCSDGSDESSCLESSRHKGGGHSGGQDRGKLQSNGANSSSTAAVQMVSLPVPTTTPTDRAVAVGSTTVSLPSESRSVVEGERTSIAPKVSPTRLELPSVDQKLTPSQDARDEIKQEKMERSFWRMEKNHGAIVALVLGIVLMTVLLILAGCRLRHFRKRYRKGRHLNSNEADYLINGMYL